MYKRICLLLCLAAALAACKRDAATPAAAGPEAAPVATPEPAAAQARPAATAEYPKLRVETIDGGHFDLTEHRGKWVVVNFWATWCAPCLKEMPELSALDAMREHVEVIGLAYEDNTPEAMREFLQAHPVVYPIALVDVYDPPADFEVPRGLPMTYLVSPEGKVAKKYAGPVSARMLEEDIAAFGAGKAPANKAG